MPAPTGSDGLRRAIEIFGLPAIAVFLLVIFVREFVGEIAAGLLYIGIVVGSFVLLFSAAKYWNIPYTIAVLGGGVVVIVVFPGVISQVLPPVFGVLATVGSVLFVVGLVMIAIGKFDVDIPIGR